jgi:hypothetical protein
MKNVVITEPSYDMKYAFVQVEEKGTEERAVSQEEMKDSKSSQRQSRTTSNTKAGLGFLSASLSGNYSSTASGINRSMRHISKKSVINGKTWYSHSMLVTVSLYSYYASLDESRSKISDAAKMLLVSNDLPGFFSSCGPYYVRSIGRHATFVSIFTYQSLRETRDEAFEDQLRTEVSKFSTESKTRFKAEAKLFRGVSLSTDKRTQSTSSRDIEEKKRRETFNRQAENYRLTINTSAYGLGKDKNATLISFDMDSYKAAVKDAFMAMQNPRTGKVTNIEVVPWVENTEFQAFVRLEEEEIPAEKGSADVTGDVRKPKRTRLLYEKKHILNQNAEFFMEIERTDRNKINMYYKARLCLKNIEMNFKEKEALKPEFSGALLVNHRGGSSVTLKFLDKKVTSEFVQGLLTKEREFMFGVEGDDAKPGAAACVRKIMDNGIYKISYRDIPECQSVLKEMGDVQSDLLENYCMPEFINE